MEKLRPKVGMGVYVINENYEVLLLLRKGDHEGGTWSPPGGHLEIGESFFECAKREVKEETNLDVGAIELIGPVNNVFSSDKHYVNVDVIAKQVHGTLKNMEPEKCGDMRWFKFDELPAPLMLPVLNLFKEYPNLKDHFKSTNSFIT